MSLVFVREIFNYPKIALFLFFLENLFIRMETLSFFFTLFSARIVLFEVIKSDETELRKING